MLRLSLKALMAGAALIGAFVFGAVFLANAAIPDADGNIHACFKDNGQMRVVEDEGECRNNETALSWVADALPSGGKAADADLLDGLDSTEFLLAGGKAADADLLDGLDSTEFLLAGGKAADADLLDGLDSTEFLLAGGRAADADLLDGLDSTEFLLASGKAADADRLDGLNSTVFVQGGGRIARIYAEVGAGMTGSFPLGTQQDTYSVITIDCPEVAGPGSVTYQNSLAGRAPVWVVATSDQAYDRISGSESVSVATLVEDHVSLAAGHQFAASGSPQRSVQAEIYIGRENSIGGTICPVYMQVLVH